MNLNTTRILSFFSNTCIDERFFRTDEGTEPLALQHAFRARTGALIATALGRTAFALLLTSPYMRGEMSDTALMPIPGQIDPVPVARDITPRADGARRPDRPAQGAHRRAVRQKPGSTRSRPSCAPSRCSTGSTTAA